MSPPEQTVHADEIAPLSKRKDARQNRERLLEAAYDVLSERGVDAQMADIAEAAGLSVGTLYRNFPSKEDLVNALVLERLRRAAERAQKAATHDDPWAAVGALFYSFAERQLESRIESQLVGGRISGSEEVRAQREATHGSVDAILKRAQRAGVLRNDVTGSDIQMHLLAIAHLASSDSPHARTLILRHVGVVLDGLRGPARTRLRARRLKADEAMEVLHHPMGRKGGAPDGLKRGRRPWPS